MNNKFKIRPANSSDVSFIAEAIIEAEKSGTNILVYSKVYEIEEPVFKVLLEKMLLEDIEGQEFCLSSFLIIEENQEKAGCCSAWVEGANGMSSWFIKSNLLATFIPNENLQKAANKSKLLSQVYIERTLGAIQIEAVYVRKKFRGKGYSKILITEQARNLKTKNNNLSNIELIVASNNTIAIKTYEKIGFSKTIEKKCNNKKILQYLPSDTIFLMKADIQKIIKI